MINYPPPLNDPPHNHDVDPYIHGATIDDPGHSQTLVVGRVIPAHGIRDPGHDFGHGCEIKDPCNDNDMGKSINFRTSVTKKSTIERLSLNSLTDLQIFVLMSLVERGMDFDNDCEAFKVLSEKVYQNIRADWKRRGEPKFDFPVLARDF